MIKRNITFETFDDEPKTITESYSFHISKREFVKLDAKYDLTNILKGYGDEGNAEKVFNLMEDLILSSIGVKSEDGKHFEKTPSYRQKFASSAAYNALFEEVTLTETGGVDFLMQVMPRDIVESVNKEKLISGAQDVASGEKPILDVVSNLTSSQE